MGLSPSRLGKGDTFSPGGCGRGSGSIPHLQEKKGCWQADENLDKGKFRERSTQSKTIGHLSLHCKEGKLV